MRAPVTGVCDGKWTRLRAAEMSLLEDDMEAMESVSLIRGDMFEVDGGCGLKIERSGCGECWVAGTGVGGDSSLQRSTSCL